MDVISKINEKFKDELPYDVIKFIKNYFDFADDLGWQYEVRGLIPFLTLYWIMCEELDNGGYFSDWCELMYDKCEDYDMVVEMCDDFNKRIGFELFDAKELRNRYEN